VPLNSCQELPAPYLPLTLDCTPVAEVRCCLQIRIHMTRSDCLGKNCKNFFSLLGIHEFKAWLICQWLHWHYVWEKNFKHDKRNMYRKIYKHSGLCSMKWSPAWPINDNWSSEIQSIICYRLLSDNQWPIDNHKFEPSNCNRSPSVANK